jgi:hypothetical protein
VRSDENLTRKIDFEAFGGIGSMGRVVGNEDNSVLNSSDTAMWEIEVPVEKP